MIRSLPGSKSGEKEALVFHVKELLEGCLACPRPEGLFYDVLDQADTFVETNLAQMLAYSIYDGISGGWLGSEYREPADQMRAAAHRKVDDLGYVQGVCGSPTFDRAGTAPEGQAFFLLMEAAWGKCNLKT